MISQISLFCTGPPSPAAAACFGLFTSHAPQCKSLRLPQGQVQQLPPSFGQFPSPYPAFPPAPAWGMQPTNTALVPSAFSASTSNPSSPSLEAGRYVLQRAHKPKDMPTSLAAGTVVEVTKSELKKARLWERCKMPDDHKFWVEATLLHAVLNSQSQPNSTPPDVPDAFEIDGLA